MCRFGQGFPLEAVLSTIKLQIRNEKKNSYWPCLCGGEVFFSLFSVLLFCYSVLQFGIVVKFLTPKWCCWRVGFVNFVSIMNPFILSNRIWWLISG